MSYEIKHRFSGKTLYVAKGAADVRAAVEAAVAEGANLRGADLRGADLGGANLRDADLRDADLRGANLRGADLRGAKSIPPQVHNDLRILLDQVGKIRAYKLVTDKYESPINLDQLTYDIGSTVKVKEPNTDPLEDCGAGVNLATLPWCLKHWKPGRRILVCEFTNADIACIPDASDGKFRVSRCKVVREIPRADIHEWLGIKEVGALHFKPCPGCPDCTPKGEGDG